MDGILELIKNEASRKASYYKVIQKIGPLRTPVLDLVVKGSPRDLGNVKDVYAWFYSNQKNDDKGLEGHKLGSAAVDLTHGATKRGKNVWQLFKDSYGVIGSDLVGENIDGSKDFVEQKLQSLISQKLKIERRMLSEINPTMVEHAANVIGRAASLYGYKAVNNSYKEKAEDILKAIKDLCRNAYNNGIIIDEMVVGSDLKDSLDSLFKDSLTTTHADNKTLGVTSYNKIAPFGHAPKGINIVESVNIKSNKFIAFGKKNIGVIFRRAYVPRDISDSVDAKKGEHVSEVTYRFDNPFAAGYFEVE